MITAGSIFLAVFFALLMRSVQLGTYGHLFGNIIESYSGYIQIQSEDFFEDQVVDNSFAGSPELERLLLEDENVKGIIPRFESFALASSGSSTRGVLVMGIDPERESALSNVEAKLVKYILSDKVLGELENENLPENIMKNIRLFRAKAYSSESRIELDLGLNDKEAEEILPHITRLASVQSSYLKTGKPGALVGGALAKYLGLSRGDTIVLLGQGYHGSTAAGKYVIEGIVSLPAPELEARLVYLPLDICQDLYAAGGMLTSIALEVKNTDDRDIDRTIARLETSLDESYRILGWRELNQAVVQQMEADNAGGMIMIVILYLVIAFGVFGTVLMMTAERRREFGVVVAIGMQKSKLAAVMIYEMLYMGIIGILMGVLAATPIIIYLYYHPVAFSGEIAKMMEDYGFEALFKSKWIDTYYLWQSLIVGIIVMVSVIYPVRKILKLKEINAIRS
jgi:ABC-type lipoprotein release transport system permease subunit